MGRLWVTEGGKRKRTEEGVRHGLWVIALKSNRFFESLKVVSLFRFIISSSLWVSDISPRGDFSAFDKSNILLPRAPIPTFRYSGISAISRRSNKSKVSSAVIEPISVDVVDKYPSISRLSDDIVVNKIRFEPSVAIVREIKSLSFIELFPYVDVNFRIPNKFIFIIMQRRFNESIVDDGFIKNALSSNRRERDVAIISSTGQLSGVLPPFLNIFVRHTWIIPRIKKFHNEVYNG